MEPIVLAGARGETVSFQVVISGTRTDLLDCRVEVRGLEAKIYRQHYVRIQKSSWNAPLPAGEFPDPLVPASTVAVESLLSDEQPQNQPFWVDVAIPRDASAGIKQAEVRLVQKNGAKSLPVTLTVWPISLPETASLRTCFGLSWRRVAQLHGMKEDQKSPELRALVHSYFALLADHHISPDEPMPLGIDVEPDGTVRKFDLDGYRKFVRTHRVSSLRVPFWPEWPFADPLGHDRTAALRYLASVAGIFNREGWMEMLYFSSDVDEPNTIGAYAEVRRWGALLDELHSRHGVRLRHLVTESPVPQEQAWGSLHGAVQTWVIHMNDLWEDERNGSRWKRHQSGAEETWAYAALSYYPDVFYATYGKAPLRLKEKHPLTWQLDFMPVNFRLSGWLCASQGHRGLLYWDTLHWPQGEDPWRNPATFVESGRVYNGDGMLIYPHKAGPCASLRLKWIRDGIQDHAMLMRAKTELPERFAAACKAVCAGVAEWSADPTVLRQWRLELGSALARRTP